MKLIVALSAGLLLASPSHAKDLAATAWKAADRAQLNAAADLRESAKALVLSLVPDADIDPPRVGEATFVDLDSDGRLELVVTLDHSGRGFFTTVMTIEQGPTGKLTHSKISTRGRTVEGLASRLRDVNRDGRIELVVQQYVDRYEGAVKSPEETLVYAWSSHRFADASDKYPAFYRAEVVPALKAKLAALEDGGSTRAVTDDHDAFVARVELERAKKRGKLK